MISSSSSVLKGQHWVVGLTGGIACYKTAELIRLLIKAQASVQVIMTQAATQFITPLTLEALSGRPVFQSTWDDRQVGERADRMPHIHLSREADGIIVAPATADFMARLLHGRCDDLLALTCLARPVDRVPLVIAPAMNREMWKHPATVRNVAQLQADGTVVLDVGTGDQACGESGLGRMLEPIDIFKALEALTPVPSLLDKQVLITAGPTYEAIDPVRGITNRSSGKMGFALARAFKEAGAKVTLIAGPVTLETPAGVKRINIESAQEMQQAVQAHIETMDIFVACAAVADWRPIQIASHKLKKEAQHLSTLEWVENPDILAQVAQSQRAQSKALFCVGFAAETQALQENAAQKRLKKQVPLLVGNIGPETFGKDHNQLILFEEQGITTLPQADKLSLARQLVSHIAMRIPQ